MNQNQKNAAELITDEWLENTLLDVKRSFPTGQTVGGLDSFTYSAACRRLLREKIVQRLGQ